MGFFDAGFGIMDAEEAADRSGAAAMKVAQEWLARRERGRESSAVDYEEEGSEHMLPRHSEAGSAYADEVSMEAQRKALEELTRLSQDGLLPEDITRLGNLNDASQQQSRSQFDAIQNRADSRGAGGGAASERMLSQMQEQSNANQGASIYRQGLVDAQNRAYAAMQDREALSSRMRQQSFDENRRRAEAGDRRTDSNAEYLRGLQQRNADRRNRGAESRSRDGREGHEDRLGWLRGDVDRERYYHNESEANNDRYNRAARNAIEGGAGLLNTVATAASDEDDDD